MDYPLRAAANAPEPTGTAIAPARSDSTLEAYRTRGQALVNSYMREMSLTPGGGESSPEAFANWLAAQRPNLSPATWRLYRQAALFYIDGWPNADLAEVARTLEDALQPGAKLPPRTSARKQKRIPAEDFRALCGYLIRDGSTSASWETRDWVIAGVATGLRPSEWREATLYQLGDQYLLRFRRKKTTNGRGLGVIAILDLSALGQLELAAIGRMAEHGRAWHAGGEYARQQEAHGQVLRAACQALWPQRARVYSLYSCRHQATSHMKVTLTPEQVAAVLGHAVTDTMVSYGKGRHAWSIGNRLSPPRPMPGSAEKVRRTRKTMRPHRDLLAENDTPPVTQGPR